MKRAVHRQLAFAIQIADKPSADSTAPGSLIMRPTEDGWSLIGPEGDVVFHGGGLGGRRQCLEFARDHGAISVLS